MKKKTLYLISLLILLFILSACSIEENNKISKVVVSTSIIANVAEQVNGEILEITVLLPAGVDPHSYQPTPQDIAAIADADLLLINGYGLEEYLNSIIDENDLNEKLHVVSEGIEIEDGDPHVWLDTVNVITWVGNITEAFVDLQPENEAEFRENAKDYIRQLNELDNWIYEAVGQLPDEKRILVSDHLSLGYFAQRYGFEMGGTITQSSSSLVEPSAQDLAELIDMIVEQGLQAVFIGHEANPQLAESLTDDLDIMLVELFIGSLSNQDGPAGSYIELMRFNVDAIVTALK